MIMLLKMHVSGRIFDKIRPKAIKIVFPICDLWSGNCWTEFFGGSESSNFLIRKETLGGRGGGIYPSIFFEK